MFRIPRYAIFIFVGLSILAAFGIHELEQRYIVEARVPASSTKTSSAWSILGKMFGWDSGRDDIRFQYQSERSCSAQQNELSPMLNGIPAVFRDERVRTGAEFPKECVLYAMRASQKESQVCVTKTYVNVVYNYVSDFSDCFGFPQRSLVPRFFLESGFHLNAQGLQGGIGLTQITQSSVQRANARFAEFQEFVQQSPKESCQRLQPEISKLKPLALAGKNKIQDRDALIHPLLNLFYFSIVESQNRDQLLSFINRKDPKLLASHEYDPERLLELLQILSYNLGPSSVLVHFSNYLEQFPVNTHALTKEDLSLASKRDILSFPDYLRRFQATGTSSYLNDVSEKAVELNTQFKEGTCAPEMFLSL